MLKPAAALAIASQLAFASGDVVAGSCDEIIVAGNNNYPPISWSPKDKPDRPIGIAFDVAIHALTPLNIPIKSKSFGPWARTQSAAKAGQVDLLVGLYRNQERQNYLRYAEPAFMSDPASAFVLKGQSFELNSWMDLADQRGATLIGNSYGDEFDHFATNELDLIDISEIRQFPSLLERGRIGYFLYGLYPTLLAAKELGFSDKVEAISPPVTEQGLFIAFSKKSPCIEHLPFLQKRLIQLIKSDFVTRVLLPRYLGQP